MNSFNVDDGYSGVSIYKLRFLKLAFTPDGECGDMATPELDSGALLATGLLPSAATLLYRRRRGKDSLDE